MSSVAGTGTIRCENSGVDAWGAVGRFAAKFEKKHEKLTPDLPAVVTIISGHNILTVRLYVVHLCAIMACGVKGRCRPSALQEC